MRLQEVDAGFKPHNVLSMQMRLAPPKYTSVTHAVAFYRDFLDHMEK